MVAKKVEKESSYVFNAAKIGGSLQEMAVDIVSIPDSDSIISRWYHSQAESDIDADLYVWLDNKQNIIKQQMTCSGQIVEWNILEGLKTGLTIIEEEDAEKGSESIIYDKSPQKNAVYIVLEILKHASQLPAKELKRVCSNFEKSPTLNSMGVEEFFEKFGEQKENKSSDSIWSRLKAWLGS